jgi:Ca-activated chloride channel family protein
MMWLPVAPWPVLALLAAIGGLLIWWPAGRQERPETLVTRVRRSAMVALVLVAALRPGGPGGDIKVNATDLDVYFVVDTTSSAMAEDYAAGRPRLEGMRADIKGVAAQLPGARYSVLTFDHETVTRLPLTADGAALASAADTMLPETSTWSQGSSVTVARGALQQALDRGREAHPERARVVFYLGDGEQTAAAPPQPFEIDPKLLNGGAVLGYGTAQGGQMRQTGTRSDGYITDPSTGQPARSVIDEKQLQAIGEQLGLPYLHRTADDQGAGIVGGVQLKELSSLNTTDASRNVGGRVELYWPFLLGLAVLAAWELGASIAAAAALRDREAAGARAVARSAARSAARSPTRAAARRETARGRPHGRGRAGPADVAREAQPSGAGRGGDTR